MIIRFISKTLFVLLLVSCGKDAPVETPTPQIIKYTLSFSSGSGGSVSIPGGSYETGTSVSVTATPDSEYVFVDWSNGSTQNPLSVSVNSNQTLTANFEKRKYPLTMNIVGEGSVSEEIISAGRTTTEYNSGSVIRLTANPSDEWVFTGWSGSVSSTNNPIELTVDESKTLISTFIKRKYPLTINIQGEGTVSEEIISSGKTTTEYNSGSVIRLTANPSDEWVFTGWSGSVSSTENPIELTVNESKTISVTFIKRKYPLTINIQGEGTVSEEIISSGKTKTEYNSGSVIRLTANPSDGWVFTGWSGTVVSSDNPLEISVTTSKTVTATFIIPVVLFTNRTPNYSSINTKIGNIKNNYYHPGHILTSDFIYNTIDIRENCDCTACNCQVKFNLLNNTSRYFDYNNDGLLDLFGFLQNNSNGYSVGFGKYVLVDDVLNTPDVSYFDSNVWFGGRMEINDFNGDGTDDILVYHSNDHDDGAGGFYTNRSPLEILYFQPDGTFSTVQVGPDTSLHELASFDIDNDGDIDIVNAEWWMNGQGNIEVPLFYINDGSGNFTVNDTDFLQASFYKEAGIDYAFTGVDAFDLDNDGFIDLIISGETDSEINYCIYDNPNNQFEQNCYTTDFQESIRIFWGSASATFSEDNSSRLPLPYYADGNEKLSYGVNFVDLNGNGNYDIINNGTNIPIDGNYGPNSGGYIQLYQNNGDRQFTDITDQSINVSEWGYDNKRYVDTGDIPLFYDIGVVDVDNDGDFDFIPHTINTGSLVFKNTNDSGVDLFNWQTNIGKNFHWRNDGGFFTLVNDHTDYEN